MASAASCSIAPARGVARGVRADAAASPSGRRAPASRGRHPRRRRVAASSSSSSSPPCTATVAENAEDEDDAAAADATAPLRASRRAMLALTPASVAAAAAAAATSPRPSIAATPSEVASLASSSSSSAAAAARVAPAASASTSSSAVGYAALHDPRVYNGLATADRTTRALDGLLPAAAATPEIEVRRAVAALDACGDDAMAKYRQLVSLQCTDEATFYALLEEKTEELLPVLYTPTVGDACLRFGTLSPRPPGLYVSIADAGRVPSLVQNWPSSDVRVAVITDGERILGLGDQGANGMGISAGKSMVYAACGVKPEWLLPVHVDVGTNNKTLMDDPLYVGLKQPRERGEAYDRLLDETVDAIRARYGENVIVHWEDFAPRNAFRNLKRFREKKGVRTYNDDIQGTAAVTVAGILGALRIAADGKRTAAPLSEQTVLFFGAGQANVGAASLLVDALVQDGVAREDALKKVWLFDSKGLVVDGREDAISADKAPFAHAGVAGVRPTKDLTDAVRALKPTALVGAAAQPGAFTEGIVKAMCAATPRPIVFALSNPTSKAECTAAQAYQWSKGKAIFASGTLFAPVTYGGVRYEPGFANNAFIFPGVALGALASGASSVTDGMFLAAARSLASQVSADRLELGAAYPPTGYIKEAAVKVAAAVAAAAEEEGVARVGACGGGGKGNGGSRIPSLDAGGGDDGGCANYEACVRDYLKTCA